MGIADLKYFPNTLVKANETDAHNSQNSQMIFSILTKNCMGNNIVEQYGFCHNAVAQYHRLTLMKILFR